MQYYFSIIIWKNTYPSLTYSTLQFLISLIDWLQVKDFDLIRGASKPNDKPTLRTLSLFHLKMNPLCGQLENFLARLLQFIVWNWMVKGSNTLGNENTE